MLKGLGQLGDMGKLMKQAQEMQSRMTDVQNRLDAIEVTGESGAGLVQVTATAKGAVTRLVIDPSLFRPEEREVVEDLIVAAIQDAQARAMAAAQAEVAASVRECRRCGNIAEGELCAICADEGRATGELCVVETVADLWAMERGGAFLGR